MYICHTHIFPLHTACLVDGFGRDLEVLVPKYNQYLMCNVHYIYIGMGGGHCGEGGAYCEV